MLCDCVRKHLVKLVESAHENQHARQRQAHLTGGGGGRERHDSIRPNHKRADMFCLSTCLYEYIYLYIYIIVCLLVSMNMSAISAHLAAAHTD
jgi:hypothetical protein